MIRFQGLQRTFIKMAKLKIMANSFIMAEKENGLILTKKVKQQK